MRNYLLPTALFGSIAIVSYASPAVALSPVEIQRIAKQSTMQITTGCEVGSGVIIRKDGNTYTVLTVAHTFRKKESCSPLEVVAPDTTKYQIAQVKNFPNSVDLAAFTFTSSKSYAVAKLIDNSDRVEGMENIYVSGFPMSTAIKKATFVIVKGDVVANPINTEQGNGYSLIYSNNTLPGHSGGPVWNEKGEVIAIHGRGDIDTRSQETINSDVRIKNGYSLGITINTFNKLAATAGIGGSTSTIATASTIPTIFSPTNPTLKPNATPAPIATKPTSKPLSDLFPTLFKPKLKPVDDLIALAIKKENDRDFKGMLADANSAIALDPRNSRAYVIRGRANESGNSNYEIGRKQAFRDYTQAIALDPNNAEAYYYRQSVAIYTSYGEEKNVDKDRLADLNRAIAINPNYTQAYIERGWLRHGPDSKVINYKAAAEDFSRAISLGYNSYSLYEARGNARFKSNDFQGAIEDYDRVIPVKPRNSDALYYRAMSKSKVGDKPGAIADLRIVAQAAKESMVGLKKVIEENRGDSYTMTTLHWHKDRYQKVMREITRLGG